MASKSKKKVRVKGYSYVRNGKRIRVKAHSKNKKASSGEYKQTGSSKLSADSNRLSKKKPGWRLSKSGNVYFENRKNRSDSKKEVAQYYKKQRRKKK